MQVRHKPAPYQLGCSTWSIAALPGRLPSVIVILWTVTEAHTARLARVCHLLQVAGCGLLSNLAHFVACNELCGRSLSQRGAAAVAAGALKRHPYHEGIQVKNR